MPLSYGLSHRGSGNRLKSAERETNGLTTRGRWTAHLSTHRRGSTFPLPAQQFAKCVTCGGSIVAIKRTAKHRYTRTVYQCAYHHKRGNTVCTNNVEVRQDILDSAILHAMNEALDEKILEASVVAGSKESTTIKKHSLITVSLSVVSYR